MKWPSTLRSETVAGATLVEIESFVKTVFSPLTEAEVQYLLKEHKSVVGEGHFDPPFVPTKWQLPCRPLPDEYLKFLRWSNGGYFQGSRRDLDPLFSTREVRDYMLGYSIPHWMSEACPIGFDGGGGFYLLDMRTAGSDYPVIWAHASNLGFDEAKILAPSFRRFIDTALDGD